jgi:transaldolase
MNINDLNIKIFADGYGGSDPIIQGYTTNPSLIKNSGVKDYEGFCRDMVKLTHLPVSFEVFSDNLFEMTLQARKIASFGKNVYVKIPITNTEGKSTYRVVESLSKEGIKLNITAIFTPDQVMAIEPV